MSPRNQQGAFACSACDMNFSAKSSRDAHEIKVHDLRSSLSCSYCEHTFPDGPNLKRHLRDTHGIYPPGTRKWWCIRCGVTFSTRKDNARRHVEHSKYETCSLEHLTDDEAIERGFNLPVSPARTPVAAGHSQLPSPPQEQGRRKRQRTAAPVRAAVPAPVPAPVRARAPARARVPARARAQAHTPAHTPAPPRSFGPIDPALLDEPVAVDTGSADAANQMLHEQGQQQGQQQQGQQQQEQQQQQQQQQLQQQQQEQDKANKLPVLVANPLFDTVGPRNPPFNTVDPRLLSLSRDEGVVGGPPARQGYPGVPQRPYNGLIDDLSGALFAEEHPPFPEADPELLNWLLTENHSILYGANEEPQLA